MDGLVLTVVTPGPRIRPPNRRAGLVLTIVSPTGGAAGEPGAGHVFEVMLGVDPESGRIIELFFTSRGKVGGDVDAILMDLGIEISRSLQRPDPHLAGIEHARVLQLDLGGRLVSACLSIDAGGDLAALDLKAARNGDNALLAPIGAEITAALQEIDR